jgi:hypothetical protein
MVSMKAPLHAVLPGQPGLTDLMPLAVFEERAFAGGVAARQDHDHQIGLQIGSALRWSAPEVLLKQGDDGVGELLLELAVAASGGLPQGGGVLGVKRVVGHGLPLSPACAPLTGRGTGRATKTTSGVGAGPAGGAADAGMNGAAARHERCAVLAVGRRWCYGRPTNRSLSLDAA